MIINVNGINTKAEMEAAKEIYNKMSLEEQMQFLLGLKEPYPEEKADFMLYQRSEPYNDGTDDKRIPVLDVEYTAIKDKDKGKIVGITSKYKGILFENIVKNILKEYHPFYIAGDKSKTLFLYRAEEGIHYYAGGEIVAGRKPMTIESIVKSFIPTQMLNEGKNPINLIIQLLTAEAGLVRSWHSLYDAMDPNWICFNDGMLNVLTLEEKPFSPEYFLINKVYTMRPDLNDATILERVKNSVYYEYFNGLLSESQIKEVAAMMAIGCTRIRIKKTLILIGTSNIGKTTVMDKFGKCSIERESFTHIDSNAIMYGQDRFAMYALAGKTMASGSEMDSVNVSNLAFVKNFLDCSDARGEKKYADAAEFPMYATLFITTNLLPDNSMDLSGTFENRLSIIRCLENENRKMISDFKNRLEREEDIFLWVSYGLYLVHQALLQDETLSVLQCEESLKEVERYKAKGSHVKAFLGDENYMVKASKDSDNHFRIKTTRMYQLYKDYCANEEIPERSILTKNKFYDIIENAEGITKVKSGGIYYFQGIAEADHDDDYKAGKEIEQSIKERFGFTGK